LEGGGAGGEGEVAVQEACHLDGAWIVGSKKQCYLEGHMVWGFFLSISVH
jgi:hypothetical protein